MVNLERCYAIGPRKVAPQILLSNSFPASNAKKNSIELKNSIRIYIKTDVQPIKHPTYSYIQYLQTGLILTTV